MPPSYLLVVSACDVTNSVAVLPIERHTYTRLSETVDMCGRARRDQLLSQFDDVPAVVCIQSEYVQYSLQEVLPSHEMSIWEQGCFHVRDISANLTHGAHDTEELMKEVQYTVRIVDYRCSCPSMALAPMEWVEAYIDLQTHRGMVIITDCVPELGDLVAATSRAIELHESSTRPSGKELLSLTDKLRAVFAVMRPIGHANTDDGEEGRPYGLTPLVRLPLPLTDVYPGIQTVVRIEGPFDETCVWWQLSDQEPSEFPGKFQHVAPRTCLVFVKCRNQLVQLRWTKDMPQKANRLLERTVGLILADMIHGTRRVDPPIWTVWNTGLGAYSNIPSPATITRRHDAAMARRLTEHMLRYFCVFRSRAHRLRCRAERRREATAWIELQQARDRLFRKHATALHDLLSTRRTLRVITAWRKGLEVERERSFAEYRAAEIQAVSLCWTARRTLLQAQTTMMMMDIMTGNTVR